MRECDWCGKETKKPLEKNFAGDKCCEDCIDEANERTRFFENWSDIERLEDYEAREIINTLVNRNNITLNELNDIYFENRRNR